MVQKDKSNLQATMPPSAVVSSAEKALIHIKPESCSTKNNHLLGNEKGLASPSCEWKKYRRKIDSHDLLGGALSAHEEPPSVFSQKHAGLLITYFSAGKSGLACKG